MEPSHDNKNSHSDGETFVAILDKVPFPVGLNEPDGSYIDVNKEWVRVTGIPREEAKGHTGVELGLVDEVTHRTVIDTLLVNNGKLDRFPITIRVRSGQLRDVLLSTAGV